MIKLLLFHLHSRPLLIGEITLGDQAKKRMLKLNSNSKMRSTLMLEEQV